MEVILLKMAFFFRITQIFAVILPIRVMLIRSQSLFYEFQLIYPVSISSNLDECMFDN